jgi:hypothetical protein
MKGKLADKQYTCLRPEERFKLILAAGARGDEAERLRLLQTGGTITLTSADHSPYARAFEELATLTYIELMEDVARYQEALEWADHPDLFDVATTGDQAEAGTEPAAAAQAARRGKRPLGERSIRLALAAGYVLRTKAAGWQQFCAQLPVPPWSLWALYPGYERLQGCLALAAQVAFEPEGFLCWMNERRPPGQAELTEVSLTVAGIAQANAEAFRQGVAWWGG